MLLLPAIEDGYMLKSCLEMMAHCKRGIDKEEERLLARKRERARGQGCNLGYGQPSPNAGIVALQCSMFLSTHEELRI